MMACEAEPATPEEICAEALDEAYELGCDETNVALEICEADNGFGECPDEEAAALECLEGFPRGEAVAARGAGWIDDDEAIAQCVDAL